MYKGFSLHLEQKSPKYDSHISCSTQFTISQNMK